MHDYREYSGTEASDIISLRPSQSYPNLQPITLNGSHEDLVETDDLLPEGIIGAVAATVSLQTERDGKERPNVTFKTAINIVIGFILTLIILFTVLGKILSVVIDSSHRIILPLMFHSHKKRTIDHL